MLLKQMKYFITVVDLHSFTEAAEQCFISQSAISQQIKALEKELGVRLFERSKRQFSLTAANQYFQKKQPCKQEPLIPLKNLLLIHQKEC